MMGPRARARDPGAQPAQLSAAQPATEPHHWTHAQRRSRSRALLHRIALNKAVLTARDTSKRNTMSQTSELARRESDTVISSNPSSYHTRVHTLACRAFTSRLFARRSHFSRGMSWSHHEPLHSDQIRLCPVLVSAQSEPFRYVCFSFRTFSTRGCVCWLLPPDLPCSRATGTTREPVRPF